VLRDPLVMSSVVYGFVVFVLIFGLFLTVLPILLETDLGLSAGPRGLILTASGLASTTVALNLGRLRRRLGAGRLLVGGSMLFVAGFSLVGLAASVVVVLVGVALYGLGEGMSIPTLQDLVAGAGPDASRGAVVAVWVSAVRLGQFLGSLVAAGALAVLSESAIFLAAGAFTALVALVLSRSPLRHAERHVARP
jgi:MFS transporter, ACDE family, multidrug resistance protein